MPQNKFRKLQVLATISHVCKYQIIIGNI